jgi:hypothetical protein
MKATMDHIMEHWDLWSNPANAGLLVAMGIQPAPQAPTPEMPPIEGAQGTGPVSSDANGMAEEMQPSMPNLPPGAVPVDGAAVTE